MRRGFSTRPNRYNTKASTESVEHTYAKCAISRENLEET